MSTYQHLPSRTHCDRSVRHRAHGSYGCSPAQCRDLINFAEDQGILNCLPVALCAHQGEVFTA